MNHLNPWKYFLSLEKDFIKTLQYVELEEKHFGVYSIEYAKLLMLTGAEFENMGKVILKELKSEFNVNNIGDIKQGLLENYPKIVDLEVSIENTLIKLKPFANWGNKKDSQKLFWWNNYNDLKHYKHQNFHLANMESVLNGLACLLWLNIIYYKKVLNHEIVILENGFLEVDYEVCVSTVMNKPNFELT